MHSYCALLADARARESALDAFGMRIVDRGSFAPTIYIHWY